MEEENNINIEEWDDISHCRPKPKISLTLDMASGGSHAWSYVISKDLDLIDNFDIEPEVYIYRFPFNKMELLKNKKPIIREGINFRSQEIKIIDIDEDIPEDDDTYSYSKFVFPN